MVDEPTARRIVNLVAIVHLVIAGIAALAFLPILFSVIRMFSNRQELDGFGGMILGVGIFLSLILFMYVILYSLLSYGLWKRRNWARVLLFIVSSIGVFLALYSILSLFGVSFLFGDDVAIAFFVIIGCISAALIWLFGFQKDIVALFNQPPQ